MDVGFDTIGNATLLVYDQGPLLATDPWVLGSPYFGSWSLSHQIPDEQRRAIEAAPFAWFSHGHPDHLDGASLPLLKNKTILVPDHAGGRVKNDLVEQGFNVRVLADRTWVQLSPRVRVLCIADYNQDGLLLCDVGGRLVVNLNDASDHGWGRFVRNEIKRYPISFLLTLAGFGDADMMNFHDEEGRRLPRPPQSPLGQTLAKRAEFFGCRYAIPFSAMHQFQRTDSAWAGEHAATLDDYRKGFVSPTCTLLPAFTRYDCARDEASRIDPPLNQTPLFKPGVFGDYWDDRLGALEIAQVKAYFSSVEHLHRTLDFIRVRVGGEDHVIDFGKRGAGRRRPGLSPARGITFEVPRNSLLTAVKWQIFDDLLIGNFMKTTLHGEWGPGKLYPDFSPYVAKYGDNGRARTAKELRAYHLGYLKRDPPGWLRHKFDASFLLPLQAHGANFLRSRLGPRSDLFKLAKGAWWKVKGRIA